MRKGNATCPLCRVSICFKGILKQRNLWNDEAREETYLDVMKELFEDYSNEYSHIFLICMSVIQERYNYTVKKYPDVTTDELNLILHFSWIPIEDLMSDEDLHVIEPQKHEKYLFVNGTEYSVRSSRSRIPYMKRELTHALNEWLGQVVLYLNV